MTLRWTDGAATPWVEVDEADDFGYDPEPDPEVQLKHIIAIQIQEKPGELSPLVRAIVSSFAKEVRELNALLGKGEVSAVMERWTTAAGRYELNVIDHAKRISETHDLQGNHFLVTLPAEEPGDGTWTEEFDFEIEHSSECTPAIRHDGLCPFEEEMHMAGIDAFGKPSDWDAPPFRKRIRHVVEVYPGGPWGGPEADIYIMEDE